MNTPVETVDCGMCGRPTPYLYTARCDSCWELERRLPLLLATPAGRRWLQDRLDGRP